MFNMKFQARWLWRYAGDRLAHSDFGTIVGSVVMLQSAACVTPKVSLCLYLYERVKNKPANSQIQNCHFAKRWEFAVRMMSPV